jgi:hypothetical protein
VPALRNSPKPPARVIRRGTRILRPAASTAAAGVTYDTAGATSPHGTTSPQTWIHVNSGNCVLVWSVNASSVSNPVTAVTYGGVTLPLIKAQQTTGTGGGVAVYGLAGPTVPTGSNTVSVTYTTGGADQISGSVSASGAGSIGTPVSAASSVAVASFSVTLPSTTAGGLVVVGTSYGGNTGSGVFSGTNGVTIRVSDVVSSTQAADNMAAGTVASAGGSQTAGVSDSAGNDLWAMAAVELLPASTSGLGVPQRPPARRAGAQPDLTRATFT